LAEKERERGGFKRMRKNQNPGGVFGWDEIFLRFKPNIEVFNSSPFVEAWVKRPNFVIRMHSL
jgi:hypothetical protein